VELSWQLSDALSWEVGLATLTPQLLSTIGGLDRGGADIFNYAVTLAPDLGGEGNLLGFVVGMEPKQQYHLKPLQ